MAKFYIQTTVNYWFEGDFDTEEEAEAFGWNIDEMNYGEVDEIKIEELEEDEDEDE